MKFQTHLTMHLFQNCKLEMIIALSFPIRHKINFITVPQLI
jgi:hypothetical protein